MSENKFLLKKFIYFIFFFFQGVGIKEQARDPTGEKEYEPGGTRHLL